MSISSFWLATVVVATATLATGCSTFTLLSVPANYVVQKNSSPTPHETRPPIVSASQELANRRMIYIVQPGDTVYSIAWAFELNDQKIIALNHLEPPYQLTSGEELLLQDTVDKSKTEKVVTIQPIHQTAPDNNANKLINDIDDNDRDHDHYDGPKPVKTVQIQLKSVKQNIARPRSTAASRDDNQPRTSAAAVTYWAWPTKGTVITQFNQSGLQKGVELRGEYGQEIRAAQHGRVVYSGNSLNYFDNLIIIKHDQDLMSAYGYNAHNLVKVGDQVERGQKIALMGHHHNKPTLYFEIRHKGKPINPQRLLPKLSR